VKNFYTRYQISERWPYLLPGIYEPAHRHFHFRPARPANLLVTLDRETGEVNVSAGTIAPLSWDPYTIVIHCAKSSLDSVHNIQQVGAECVIGLPTKDIVYETWCTALCVPRGVNEAIVARLTQIPSHVVKPPSIAECPINFECVIEWYREQHSHYIAGLRVLGASVDERLFDMPQEEAMHWYPTWEVDDIVNEWGGSVERLGVLGEFLPTPRVPVKRGWGASAVDWLADLHAAGELNDQEFATAQAWLAEWEQLAPVPDPHWGAFQGDETARERSARREALKQLLTRLFEYMAWEEMDALHALLCTP